MPVGNTERPWCNPPEKDGDGVPALQISLDLCITEKELAKTHSQISFIYFQSHS